MALGDLDLNTASLLVDPRDMHHYSEAPHRAILSHTDSSTMEGLGWEREIKEIKRVEKSLLKLEQDRVRSHPPS